MKLTCDSCNAKYSIADDRVAGKVFKIRCKKCSHIIMVRGTALASVPEPTPDAFAAVAASGEWHAVVDGQQIGPFERAEVLRRREAGELADDTFVWREGMSDWAELGALDELRPQPSRSAESAAMPAAVPSVEVAEMTRLRNERNETSVLFTLGNLAQLASKPASKPATTSSSGSGGTPGEEGSGLIDIRALASTWAQPGGAAPVSVAATAIDHLPIYATTGLADPIVLLPTRPSGVDRRIVIVLVAMFALIATLVTVLVIVLTRPSSSSSPAPFPTPVAVAAPPVAVAAPPVAAEPPPIAVAPPPVEAPAPPVAVAPPPAITQPPTPPRSTSRSTTKRSNATRPPPTPPALQPPATTEACTDVGCAYSDYAEKCCERFKPKDKRTTPITTTPPATAGELPENLDRGALAKGIASIKAQKCGASSSAKGDVHVSVKVTADGAVSSVTVKSTPDQALATCVVREAKQGTFAKTKRGGSFSYFWRF